ncbi:MAG: DUF2169 domain-containing protein [Enhygromyxa sp.]
MNFTNETELVASWTTGFDREGRELLAVVAKGTYALEPGREDPVVAAEQAPLTEADEFTGDPGHSAPLYETDFAHHKPVCDVLLNGSAWAPNGVPAASVEVGLQVGPMRKTFEVVGNRAWSYSRLSGTYVSQPQPFTRLPISYDVAFGGTDTTDPDDVATYLENPVGRGFGRHPAAIDGALLPNTQATGESVTSPTGKYRPMAFGPVGRSWAPRFPLAGTYDQRWLAEQAPFWPHDFDYRYFQAAPPDQQIPHPAGGEAIVLLNLTASGLEQFRLPRRRLPILLIEHNGQYAEKLAVLDTVLIEPDLGRLCLTWRLCHPLRRDPFELREVVVGGRSGAWKARQRAAITGRRYYRSLAELVEDRKRRARL